MIHRVYLAVPNRSLVRRVVREVHEELQDRCRIQLFAERTEGLYELPAAVSAFSTTSRTVVLRSLFGGVVALVITAPLLAVGAPPVVLPVLILTGMALGAAGAFWPGQPGKVAELRSTLGPDGVLMLVDVGDADLRQVEQRIPSRHPEIRYERTEPVGVRRMH